MFEIEIVVEACEMTGLQALDWRRNHGMFDGVKVVIDRCRKTYKVDEAFARKWFESWETCPHVVVAPSDLLACDVSVHRNYSWIVHVEIGPERARELFADARSKAIAAGFDDMIDFKYKPLSVSGPVPAEHPRFQPGVFPLPDHALERGGSS